MGRINAIIPDKLERKFRAKAAEKYLGKGNVGTALAEAIELWLKKQEVETT